MEPWKSLCLRGSRLRSPLISSGTPFRARSASPVRAIEMRPARAHRMCCSKRRNWQGRRDSRSNKCPTGYAMNASACGCPSSVPRCSMRVWLAEHPRRPRLVAAVRDPGITEPMQRRRWGRLNWLSGRHLNKLLIEDVKLNARDLMVLGRASNQVIQSSPVHGSSRAQPGSGVKLVHPRRDEPQRLLAFR